MNIIDLKKEGKINIDSFRTKAEYSPFDKYPYKGKQVMTIVSGKIVMDNL